MLCSYVSNADASMALDLIFGTIQTHIFSNYILY